MLSIKNNYLFLILIVLLSKSIIWCLNNDESNAKLEKTVNKNLLIIVLNDLKLSYHLNKYELFKLDLNSQLNDTKIKKRLAVDVIALFETWPDLIGAWTIIPLLKDIDNLYSKKFDIFLFCEEDSRVDLLSLYRNVLNKLDIEKPLFVGYPLYDSIPTIIHHYAFHENSKKFLYPDFAACFLMNRKLIQILGKQKLPEKSEFSIDIKHELAKWVYNNNKGYSLTKSDYFCNDKKSTQHSCVTWYDWSVPNCQEHLKFVSNENVFFGVKTYSGYHENRISIVKKTWYQDTSKKNVVFFSDIDNKTIPTIKADVNTKAGHCGKTFSIFKYFKEKVSKEYDILVVCDDDTLLNVDRLFNLISCYYKNDSNSFMIGERYGYGFNEFNDEINKNFGYNYLTGGSGMIFSRKAVEILLENCKCPRPDTPDDMYIGVCAKYLDINLIHSNLMHQARPHDYSEDYLKHQLPISFHKHWESDPILDYNKWLKSQKTYQHNEF